MLRPVPEYEIGELKIRTLKSTDVGVAFLVETDKKKIYHAGDLNWWHWQGEEKYWNNNMASNYKRSVDQLDGETLDAAFLPLDPRAWKCLLLGNEILPGACGGKSSISDALLGTV